MRRALIGSLMLHAGILAAATASFEFLSEPDEFDITVVEIIEYDEIDEAAAPLEPEPQRIEEPEIEPEPEPEPEVPPPPARVEEAPPPPPEAPALQAEKPQPKPEQVTRDIPNITPRDKPKPPRRFDPTRIAALLDKRQEDAEPRRPVAPRSTPATEPKPARQFSALERARRTATIQQAIQAQIEPCWSAPVGAAYAETLIVKIRIQLLPDGRLSRPPEIDDRARLQTDSFFRAAAEAARRAIQRCAPLKLPVADYEAWRDVELNFDPSKM